MPRHGRSPTDADDRDNREHKYASNDAGYGSQAHGTVGGGGRSTGSLAPEQVAAQAHRHPIGKAQRDVTRNPERPISRNPESRIGGGRSLNTTLRYGQTASRVQRRLPAHPATVPSLEGGAATVAVGAEGQCQAHSLCVSAIH